MMRCRQGPPACLHQGVYVSGGDPAWYGDIPPADIEDAKPLAARAETTSGANLTGTPSSRSHPSMPMEPVWTPASGF